MATYTAGTAFLQVVPSMRGFHNEVRSQLRTARYSAVVELKPKGPSAAEINAAVPKVRDQTAHVRVEVDKRSFADTTNAVALLARNLATLTVPVGLGAAAPVIAGLGIASAQASGSLLVLPAALLAAGAAAGTMAVGFAHVSDALGPTGTPAQIKKVNEALAALPPEARSAVQEIRGLGPAWSSVRMDVQTALFRDLTVEVRALAGTYLPVLRTGMTGIATEMNGAARGVSAFVREGQTVADVQAIFATTRTVVGTLSPALVDVLAILRDVGAVGLEFLPGLAHGFAMGAASAREFIASARESGRLAEWIDNGFHAMLRLGQITGNVGGIIINIFRSSGIEAGAFLDKLMMITFQWRMWTQSAQGSEVIRQVFSALVDLGSALAPILGLIVAALVRITIAVGPALPPLVTGLADVLAAASPLTALFLQLAVAVLPPLGAALSFLAPVLGPIVAAILAAQAAQKLWTAATIVAAAVQGGYAAVMWTVSAATTAYNVALAIARGNINLVALAQWALNAAWAANPIGVVVVALGLLVGALVLAWNHSETFRRVVMAAWEGIKSYAETTWASLKTIFAALGQAVIAVGGFFTSLWRDYVVPMWEGIVTTTSSAVSTVGGFFMGLWTDYVKPAWEGIVEVGKWALAILLAVVLVPIQIAINVLAAVWTELSRIAGVAWEVIKQEGAIWAAFLQANVFEPIRTYIIGPLITAWNFLRDVAVAAWVFIRDNVAAAWAFLRDSVWTPLVTFLAGVFSAAWTAFRDLAVSLWTGLRDFLAAAWAFIRDSIWNPIVNFLATVFAEAWRGWVLLATTLWTGLRDFLAATWAFIRDSIWNPIVNFLASVFAPAWQAFTDLATRLWNTLRDVVNAGWIFIRDNVWNPLVTFIRETIPAGFQYGVDAVGRLWNGIKAALRTPLQIAIDIVWNNGIVKVWDLVRGIIPGLPDIPGRNFQLPALAAGGPVEKPTVALIGEDGPEYVLSAPAVRAAGGVRNVETMHQAMMSPRRTAAAINSGSIVEGADHTGMGPSRAGLGGVAPHVGQAANYLGPKFGIGTILGVGSRPNASDHPKGLALDFMTTGNNGTALNNFLLSAANWNHFAVKYTIWRQRYYANPGSPGSFMANRGSPTANHMDHVHVSFTGTPGSGAMDGGGGGPSILDLLTQAWSTVAGAVSKLGELGGSPWGQAVGGFGRKVVDEVWKFVSGKASAMMATASANLGANGVAVVGPNGEVIGSVGGAGSGNVQSIVSGIAAGYGWNGGAEWAALSRLIQKESSWNPNAQNPTSTAYGLFQFLNSTWAASGVAKTSDPAAQTRAGLNYIRSRYGSPSRALAFHNANNWYDDGGVATGRGIMLKNIIAPERTLSAHQTEAFDDLVGTIAGRSGSRVLRADGVDTASGRQAGSDGPMIGTLIVPTPEGAGVNEVVDSVMTRARHERKARRYGRAG